MPQYKVLKPICIDVRVEKDSVVELKAEDAKNIGVGEYLEALSEDDVVVDGTTEEVADTTPETTETTEETNTPEEETTEDTPETTEDETSEVPEGSVAHVVTEEDLQANPALADDGVKVGDTVYIPETTEEEKTETETKE